MNNSCDLANVVILFARKEIIMGTMNISLPDPMKSWVEDQAKAGRYANSSDYVRDLIRRDRARTEAIAEIQAAVDAGLASGPAAPLDRSTFKSRMRAEYAGE
jgi:antitoxin ParD1/3/4